jgi:hypothetical protein
MFKQTLRPITGGSRAVLIYALALMYGWTLWACSDDSKVPNVTGSKAAAVLASPTHSVVNESSAYELKSSIKQTGSNGTATYEVKINDVAQGTFSCATAVVGTVNCSKSGGGDLDGVTAFMTNEAALQTVVIPINTTLYDTLAAKGTILSSMTFTRGGSASGTSTINIKDGRTNIQITNLVATSVLGSAFSAEYTHAPLKSTSKKVTWVLTNKTTNTSTTVEATCSNPSIPTATCTADDTTSGTVAVAGSALPTIGEYTLQGTLKDSANNVLNSSSATIKVGAAPLARLVAGTTTARLEVGKPFALNAQGSTFLPGYKVEYLVGNTSAIATLTDTGTDVPSVSFATNPGIAATVTLKITFGGQSSTSTVAIGTLLATTGAGS